MQIFKLNNQYVIARTTQRGRVNVVMNYQGQLEEMKKFRDFVTTHRQLGNSEVQEVFSKLSNSQLKYNQDILIRLKDNFLTTQKLQTEYLKQFNHMSVHG